MSRLPLGPYWGLRRLADDGGRFMLLDLRGIRAAPLGDLLRGLAPFATGVLLDSGPALDAWRDFGSPHLGLILTGTAADAARAAADAVLGDSTGHERAHALGLARLGDDTAADLALTPRPDGPWLHLTGERAPAAIEPAAGYLMSACFAAPALLPAVAERHLVIADDLVPRLQALNARVADLPRGTWLDG